MAEEAQTEEEPSIEEILDSIRQIISEDDEDSDSAEGGESPSEPVSEEVPEVDDTPLDQSAIDDMDFDAPMPASDDVEPEPEVELDQAAIDDIAFDEPEPEAEEVVEEEIIDLVEKVESEPEDIQIDIAPEPEPVEEVVPAAPEPEVDLIDEDTNEDDSSLLSQGAEKAAVSAITELVRKTAVEHNGITLEDIVRSEIKPMLKEWLDKNLPIIIERLVQEELERVSKRVLDE